jgi:hypothetical protein
MAIKVLFAPGTLEALEEELSPEDLQEFMDNLKAKMDDGSLGDDATLIDMDELQKSDPETYNHILAQIAMMEVDMMETPRVLH